MKIAHLILCHSDLEHIERLVRRLSSFSDVFIHLDKKVDDSILKRRLKDDNNCFFLNKRLHCRWGGWNAVAAEIELIRLAMETDEYDRIVFLQGADYPIKSNEQIVKFFEERINIEFIRGCDCSNSRDPYFYMRCRGIFFYNWIKLINIPIAKLEFAMNTKLRSGYIESNNKKYHVYWGSALWAITGRCAKYILEFHDRNPKFNKWFRYSFPTDELYFTTIVLNSEFASKNCFGGAEPEKKGLMNWNNLHCFRYGKDGTYTYTVDDFNELMEKKELYCRKVSTCNSKELLDKLDKNNI